MRLAWSKGFQPGQVIDGRWELGEPIGRGGFGVVLRARDLWLRRDVALKALPPGVPLDEGTRREAEVAAQLEHENLVRIYELGVCESGVYFIFELLAGETLAARVGRGPLPIDDALRIALDVARALVHAHARGVLHRDLKPANVFLTDGGRVKVLDFGLAYYFGEGPSRSGTPGYMSPEQRRGGSEDPRTDLYAVGVLLRTMVSGQPPPPEGQGSPIAGETRLPRKVASLIERTSSADPGQRPADAATLAAELEGLLRERVTRRDRTARLAILASMACAGALVGVGVAHVRDGLRRQPVVAVADLEDGSGEAGLQGVGPLLATALEQWPRFSVVPRARLLSLAGEPAGLSCAQARQAAARTSARAVLCGRVVRGDSGFVVEVEPLDPVDGTRLAPPIRETVASPEGVPSLVDGLAGRIRRALLSPVPWPWPASISGMTTTRPEALLHYVRGIDCADRPAHGQDCAAEFRKALLVDPGFGLAAYRLATWLHWFGGSREEQRELVARALRSEAALPDKERALLRAWDARLDGRDEEALDLLVRTSRIWRQDPEAHYQAADLLRHLDRPAEALPWFERTLSLQPNHAWALGGLVQCLGPLGRQADLRTWAARWESDPRPATLHALTLARGWMGDLDGAVKAARTALSLGAGPPAPEDLLTARVFAGDLDGVEGELRRIVFPGSPALRMGRYGLAAIAAYHGRPRAAEAEMDALAREEPAVARDAVYHAIRADLLLGQGDAGAVWLEVDAARKIDPRLAAEHAVSLAWLGDVEHARLLSENLGPDEPMSRTVDALLRFRQGDRQGALAELRRISDTTPAFTWRVAPLFLYGALLAEDDQDAAAIEALGRAERLYLPLAMWRAWAYPRGLSLVARSNARLGRRAEALATLDGLLGFWSDAEAAQALLSEALALRASVASP
jgi:serine/threonine protein kinase